MRTEFSIMIFVLSMGLIIGSLSTLGFSASVPTNNNQIGQCASNQPITTVINGLPAIGCISPNFATIYSTGGNQENIQQAIVQACQSTNTKLSTFTTTITGLTSAISYSTITTTIPTQTTTISFSTTTITITQTMSTITSGTITLTAQTQTRTETIFPCDNISPANQTDSGFQTGTTPCSSNTPLGSIYCSLSGLGQDIRNGAAQVYCGIINNAPPLNTFNGFNSQGYQNCLSGIAIGNAIPNIIQGSINAEIQNQLGVSAGGQTSNNNTFGIFSNPLNQALLVLGLFLALGILAGLFGAGQLANLIAVAGLTLSIITYTEGQLGIFGAIPALIYIPIQSMILGLMIILVWGSLKQL